MTNLFRKRDGNLQQKTAETSAQLESARAEGWLPEQEMWPESAKKDSKK